MTMFIVVAWKTTDIGSDQTGLCREAARPMSLKARQDCVDIQQDINNDKGLDVFWFLKIFKTKHDKTTRNASNEQGYAAKRRDKTSFNPLRNRTERFRNHSNEVTRRLEYATKHDHTSMLLQGYAAKRRGKTTSFLLYFYLITSWNHNRALS